MRGAALILLLFATFLSVPLVEVGRSFRDARFLVTVLVANFAVVPLVAWGLSRFVADDRGLLLGVLFVLLTPCIDYVIVFTGLAGGARARLLAAAPLLMLVQILPCRCSSSSSLVARCSASLMYAHSPRRSSCSSSFRSRVRRSFRRFRGALALGGRSRA